MATGGPLQFSLAWCLHSSFLRPGSTLQRTSSFMSFWLLSSPNMNVLKTIIYLQCSSWKVWVTPMTSAAKKNIPHTTCMYMSSTYKHLKRHAKTCTELNTITIICQHIKKKLARKWKTHVKLLNTWNHAQTSTSTQKGPVKSCKQLQTHKELQATAVSCNLGLFANYTLSGFDFFATFVLLILSFL